MTTPNSEIRSLPLSVLVLSQTPMQVERRKYRTKEDIRALAATLKSVGLIHPIVVRPNHRQEGDTAWFEIIAGEGRYLAAKEAGFTEITADVRELDDAQVEEVQIIENLQRKDLHALVEAEGYEQLHKRGISAEEIAARVGKSKAYVYAREKLLALCKEAREAFREGKIDASKALLLARIPLHPLQVQALKEIGRDYGGGETMSYREAAELIRRQFMLRLADAPFPTDDAQLLKNTPACGRCPKNTASEPDLFADVSTKDALCTDRVCFAQKRAAHQQVKIDAAIANGQQVFTGKEAKKLAPRGIYSLQGGYVRMDDTCYEAEGYKTYRQLLGRGVKPDLLDAPDGEGLIPVVQKAQALKLLKEKGLLKKKQPSSSGTSSGVTGAALLREKKAEKEYERRLFLAVHAKAPKKLSREMLVRLADELLSALYHETPNLEAAWGWKDGGDVRDLEKLSEPQLHQLLFEMMTLKDGDLEPAAKKLKIDAGAIRKAIAAAAKAKKKTPAKASKKKGKRK